MAGCRNSAILVASVAMLLKPLDIRPKLSYKLSTEIFSMDSTFYWDTDCADSCEGYLERTRQTLVGVFAYRYVADFKASACGS